MQVWHACVWNTTNHRHSQNAELMPGRVPSIFPMPSGEQPEEEGFRPQSGLVPSLLRSLHGSHLTRDRSESPPNSPGGPTRSARSRTALCSTCSGSPSPSVPSTHRPSGLHIPPHSCRRAFALLPGPLIPPDAGGICCLTSLCPCPPSSLSVEPSMTVLFKITAISHPSAPRHPGPLPLPFSP